MTTIDDQATEREEQHRDIALSKRLPDGPIPCGVCYNCVDPVEGDLRWCCTECRDDWQARQEK